MKKLKIYSAVFAILLAACTKEKISIPHYKKTAERNSNQAYTQQGYISVELTESGAPENYNLKSITLDIKAVDVQYSSDLDGNWTHLTTKAGLYDILTLKNFVAATIAGGKYKEGTISALRFVLGENSFVSVWNENNHPLIIPEEIKSGIVLYSNAEVSNGNYLLSVLTIDGMKCVLYESGQYTFRPAIELKNIIK